MEFHLTQVAEATGAKWRLSDAEGVLPEATVYGWSIDSRTVAAGDLFFAIKGERFDGHAFVSETLQRGAVAALVSEPVAANGIVLQVPDTLQALQRLAHWARRQWNRSVIAVTGSAGKTSTKDVIAALLAVRLRVGKTIGNLNNHFGLPLTLLRMRGDSEAAVVELGMNHAGEIRQLTAIAEPQIGVITNVGHAHIEAFSSIDDIAAAKRELVEGLDKDGIAVLNADDERVLGFRDVHGGRVMTYGLSAAAEVRAEEVSLQAEGSAFTVRGVRFQTSLPGRHAISNILAGIAVARLFEIPERELVPVVSELQPGKMRGERRKTRGVTILNDSYNSNPAAARSMIEVLRDEPATRRIAVLGEMLELGQWAETLHRELGRYAAEHGVDVLLGVRGASRSMVDEAVSAGMGKHADARTRAALFFDDPQSAGEFLRSFVRPGDAVLFKGSRGTQVEKALARMEE